MASKKIKETCSCGAILEYEIHFTRDWADDVDDRQRAFHMEHSRCRDKANKSK